MKILVTGGGGFLGQAVIRQLLARGDQVVTLNRSAYPKLEKLGVDCRQGDIADSNAVLSATAGCDAIIHVAAKVGPGLHAPDFIRPNVTGTENVLAACARRGIGLLVYTSSPSVVHCGDDIENGDESLPYPDNFQAPYPETKAACGDSLAVAATRRCPASWSNTWLPPIGTTWTPPGAIWATSPGFQSRTG